MTTFWTVSGDATDPRRLGEFWKLALGYVDEPGYDFEDGAALIDPEGVLPPHQFLEGTRRQDFQEPGAPRCPRRWRRSGRRIPS
jgi:hypothetical protein